MKKYLVTMTLAAAAMSANTQLIVDSVGHVGVGTETPWSLPALEITIDGLSYFLNENNHEAVVSNGNKWHGKLHIPSEVTYGGQTYKTTGLNWNAFHDCSELTSIKIPQTIEDVTHYSNNYEKLLISSDLMNPFAGCTVLDSIEVDKDNPSMKSIDGVLFSKDGTRLYCFPAGIKLKRYVVPEGVTWIGINALAYTNLKEVDLPESLQTICHLAFVGCSLEKVIIRGILDEQSVNSYLFYGLSESAKIYVPALEVERYKSLYSGTVLPLEEYKEDTAPVTFTEGQMATIILPTEPDASKGKYYRLDRVEDGQIVFEQEQQPRARVPYIIVPDEDFSIELNAAELAGLKPDTASIKGISFIGTYFIEVLSSPGGEGEGSFYYDIIDQTPDCSLSPSEETEKGAVVGALRAYLEVCPKAVGWDDPYHPGGTRAASSDDRKMTIVLKDDPSGLQMVNGKLSNDKCYDLQGATCRAQTPDGGFWLTGDERPVCGNSLCVRTGGDLSLYTFRWTRGDALGSFDDGKILSAAPACTITDDDYEHWLRVAVCNAAGDTVFTRDTWISKLPVLYIDTEDGRPITSKKDYVQAKLRIQGNADYMLQYDGKTEIRGRGTTSWAQYPQKPYKLKLDEKTSLFGFGKSKHWVLISNFNDKSCLRNYIASELAERLGALGMKMTWVDVILNGEAKGCYMLSQHIRPEKNSVDIFDWEGEAEDVADALFYAVKNDDALEEADRDLLEETMKNNLSWVTSGTVSLKGKTYNLSDYGLKKELLLSAKSPMSTNYRPQCR